MRVPYVLSQIVWFQVDCKTFQISFRSLLAFTASSLVSLTTKPKDYRLRSELFCVELGCKTFTQSTNTDAATSTHCGCCRFVLLCDCILSASDTADTQRHFADDFMSTLLTLHTDRVANVRITLARTLAKHSLVFGK